MTAEPKDSTPAEHLAKVYPEMLADLAEREERAGRLWDALHKLANESKPPKLAQKTLNEVAWRPLKRRRK